MKSNSDTNKKYDQEYKNDVARMVIDGGRTVREVSSDTGVSVTTAVRTWAALFRKSRSPRQKDYFSGRRLGCKPEKRSI